MLKLPPLLDELIASGRWPKTAHEAMAQNLKSRVPVERVRSFAAEESAIYLLAPPFHTVRERSHHNNFWSRPKTAPSEIDFDLAIDIADFGLGSDAPILLDYRLDASNPRVIRLRWPTDGTPNHWVVAAPDFSTFVEILGL